MLTGGEFHGIVGRCVSGSSSVVTRGEGAVSLISLTHVFFDDKGRSFIFHTFVYKQAYVTFR